MAKEIWKPIPFVQAKLNREYRYFIGIDTGTNTGLAMWNRENKYLSHCETLPIHRALEFVRSTFQFQNIDAVTGGKCFVRVEDARKRKFFKGENFAAKQQGAGSIKRDAVIWEDALTDWHIDFEMIKPGATSASRTEEYFKQVTGWKGRTSHHARDAAWIVHGI